VEWINEWNRDPKEMPMAIEYLQIVSVPVRDQDQAKDFCVHGLGWDLLSDEGYELADGRRLRWLEVRPHSGQTAITLIMEDDVMKAGSAKGLILRTSDLDSTVADLAGRGVWRRRRFKKPRGRDIRISRIPMAIHRV
jgi:hypothetical protein